MTYGLSRIDQAVGVATTLTRSWFRGHASVVGELTPRIHRAEFMSEIYGAFRPAIEMEMIEAFKREAPSLPDVPLPAESDRLGWLYVMQHYRTPTRLLDWTKNLLVALFFVVSDQPDQDGELWAMNPLKLNGRAGIPGIPLPDASRALKALVEEPYWTGSRQKLAESLGLKTAPTLPLAFEPSRRFARLVRQSGAFTIHPPPAPGATIPDTLSDPKDLVRYVVPASAKERLFNGLRALGVDEYTLFPELEGLSKRIEHEARILGYGPPAPPVCDGPA
ncbi:MAG: FRG domain-containing protein [Gemmatimonadota bacterium]